VRAGGKFEETGFKVLVAVRRVVDCYVEFFGVGGRYGAAAGIQ
jgi:hypothetical protein